MGKKFRGCPISGLGIGLSESTPPPLAHVWRAYTPFISKETKKRAFRAFSKLCFLTVPLAVVADKQSKILPCC